MIWPFEFEWSAEELAALRRKRALAQRHHDEMLHFKKMLGRSAASGIIADLKRIISSSMQEVRACTIVLRVVGPEAPFGRILRVPAELADLVQGIDPAACMAVYPDIEKGGGNAPD